MMKGGCARGVLVGECSRRAMQCDAMRHVAAGAPWRRFRIFAVLLSAKIIACTRYILWKVYLYLYNFPVHVHIWCVVYEWWMVDDE